MNLDEKIIKREIVFEGDFLKIENLMVELPDGKIGNRDVVRHPGTVAVLAFIEEDTVIIVKQFRAALNKTLLEIPAGKLEVGEDPLEAAHRELEEETGYKSNNIEYLGTMATGPGFTDELIHLYKAIELFEGVKGGDDDEFIEVYPYKLQEIKDMIRSGLIIDAKTITSLMYL